LVLEKYCTWTEVATLMSIDDVMDLCDIADVWHDAQNDREVG
jgi:hypothetical protein